MRHTIIFVAILSTVALLGQTPAFSKKAQQLIGTFNVLHITPPANDETMSAEIVDLFIDDLDNSGIILKQSDVTALRKNGNKLLDQIGAQNNDYILFAERVFTGALNSLDSILTVLSARPLDFSGDDTLRFLPSTAKIQYSASLKGHAKRIEKYIKYKSCEKVSNTDTYPSLTEKEFNTKAQEFSKGIIENFKKGIKAQAGSVYQDLEGTLLNAIALRYDPHSNYFTEEQNQQFNQQLSATVETFGLELDENEDGAICVSGIDPGGSAWMSNDINEGDLFISVKIGPALIVNGDITAYEIQTKLNNCSEKMIVITLKKPNGLIKKVKLIKQKISSEENTVKGYVLKDKHVNIGYLSLPSFYTDMEDHHLPGCANDVAKEILKLERDTIQGLIIDLRNNGGGSMQEAMNLAGIFIDEGPLFIYKEKNKKPTLIKDINRGSIFKKPIIVIINEASASASELFSNIVKDYNLGLVVGQNTYGKGTAQNVLPLDTSLSKFPNLLKTNKDFIKITTAKFYRLNCYTHQGDGVSPDIEFPSLAGYSNYKENKEKYYLLPDSVTKKLVFSPKPAIPLETLRTQSKTRIAASAEFKKLILISDTLATIFNLGQKVPLRFNDFKKYKSEMDSVYSRYENASHLKNGNIYCVNNSFDKDLYEVNPQVKEFNSKIRKSIQEDLFINESFEIFKDLIKP